MKKRFVRTPFRETLYEGFSHGNSEFGRCVKVVLNSEARRHIRGTSDLFMAVPCANFLQPRE